MGGARRRLEARAQLATRLLRARALDDLLRAVCEEAAHAVGFSPVSLYVFDAASAVASAAFTHGGEEGASPRPVPRAAVEARIRKYGALAQFPDFAEFTDLPNHAAMMALGVRSLVTSSMHATRTGGSGAQSTSDQGPTNDLLAVLVLASHGVPRTLDDDEMAFIEEITTLTRDRLEELREVARDRRIVANMTEGVAMVDAHGTLLYMNETAERMLGYGPSELIGLPGSILCFPEDVAAQAERRKALEENPVPLRKLLRFRTKDGREVFAAVSAVALHDGRALTGFLSILSDVTASRKLEAKLLHSQKLESLGVLAGGIAHDFNNLLVGVLGNAGLALDELPPESPSRDQLNAIQVAAGRAAELTKQLLAYAGKGRFVIGKLDLKRVVEEMGHLLAAVIPKNVVIKYNFAKNLPQVEGDATQLRQVVMNLITNAADAIGQRSGIITVGTSLVDANHEYLADTYIDETLPAGYYVCLEVSDTGAGMTAETRAKIFDPFFTTKFTGRGLGLAAVLGILRSHGGAIKVYSELERGTTFKVLLPAVNGPADAQQTTPSAKEEWRGSGTLLVVDDEEAVRTVMKRTFERVGFRVLVAGDGLEGLEVFRAHRQEIRAVLLDVTMPHMGGEETFRQLRQIDPEVRVLLSSGYSEQEATSRFAGKGLAGFIEKPFRMQELLDHLRAVLEREPAKST